MSFESFNNFYTQTKQRVDCEVTELESNLNFTFMTKLTFELKESERVRYPSLLNELFILKLHCDNMLISSVLIEIDKCIYNNGIVFSYKTNKQKSALLNKLAQGIKNFNDFENYERVIFEKNESGNMSIIIPKKFLIKHVNEDCKSINLDDSELLQSKVKVHIYYKLESFHIGIVNHKFYNEKFDYFYEIFFTPNYYYNTANWVPCIYSLKNSITWKLLFIVPKKFIVLTSLPQKSVITNNSKSDIICYQSRTTSDLLSPKNIGFCLFERSALSSSADTNNTSIHYYYNESLKEKIDKSLIEPCVVSSIFNFYEELLEVDISLSLGSLCFIVVVPYLNFINSSSSLDTDLKNDSFFNIIKFPNLYIIPEKVIINDQVPDMNNFQLRSLAKLFITNFIGGIINEEEFNDFWLISALENWLVYNFMTKCYGNIYLKGVFIDTLNKYKSLSASGKERRPLYNNYFSHPIELQLDEVIYYKSLLVMLILEAYVEKTYILKAIRNIINERSKYNKISTEIFIKILKKNCGINLKKFTNIWIFKTGMVNIKYSYTYKEESNSIDLEIIQTPVFMKNAIESPYINIELDFEKLKKMNKVPPFIDFRLKANRSFDINLSITVFQTNGYEILKETHNVLLENDSDVSYKNIPLITKLRKGPIKKREQEFIQEIISNTNITKLYSNEEIEKIMTKNSVLWIRLDSEMSCLRTIIDSSDTDILFEYIKLFKDPDIYGQYEALESIYNKKGNYQQSLLILETFIKSEQSIYYKLRIQALKIYVNIIHSLNQESGYLLLVDMLSDTYNDFIKNKTNFNRESYIIMKYLIKLLGEYKESFFNEFNIIGKIKISDVQKKIIDKLLIILLSNELNTVTNFNDSYLVKELLISCSQLHLQDKIIYFLKKILQLLRIEKLKRSFNEIIIIGCIEGYMNFLIQNNFLSQGYKEDSYIMNTIQSINEEINFFIQSDYERQELGVICCYFVVFMLFAKSLTSEEFTKSLDSYFNFTTSIVNNDLLCKIQAFCLFVSKNITLFLKENLSSHVESYIKSLLLQPFIQSHIDLRNQLMQIFRLFPSSTNDQSNKFVDETWLNAYINNIKQINKSKPNDDSDNDSDQEGDNIKMKVIKYQSKYSDPYMINYDLNLDQYSEKDIMLILLEKINQHPLSEHFNYPLTLENLGDLYESYHKLIKTPIDLFTIEERVNSGYYTKVENFISDIKLIFSNARLFNDRKSLIHQSANQLEEFFNILSFSIAKADKRLNAETKISLNTEEIRHKAFYHDYDQSMNKENDKLSYMDIDELNSDH